MFAITCANGNNLQQTTYTLSVFAQTMIMLFPRIRNRWFLGERKTENSLLRMIANANVWQKTNIMIWARINEQ